MAQTAETFGRVDEKGNVQVLDGDTWRDVGSYPDGTPEEALGFFVRKYEDLESGVILAEQRTKAQAPVRDVRAQVNKLDAELVEPQAVGNLPALRERIEKLKLDLDVVEQKQKVETEAAVQEALLAREALVVEMEKLAATPATKIRWKQATVTITELFEKWQAHQQTGPRLPKKAADELWARFRTARTSLEKARRAYFQELDQNSKEAKTVKRALIAEAEALTTKGASGIPAYRNLLEKWKAAPRASRSVEDTLWAAFKAAGDALYAEKAVADKQADEVNSVNLEAKLALIAEFKDILTLENREQAGARLRAFHTRFQTLGPVPKKDIRRVDDEVKKFDTHVRAVETEFWAKNDPEKQARSQSMADQLKTAISTLETKIGQASGAQKSALEAELETKKAWLAVVAD